MEEGSAAPELGGDQQGAIDATGCGPLNDAVLLCYDRHRDWRQCHQEMAVFRQCFERHARSVQDHAPLSRSRAAAPPSAVAHPPDVQRTT